MIRIEERVQLSRPADEVFVFLADFRNLPAWDPGIVEATKTDRSDVVEVGSRYDVVASFLKQRVPMRYRVAVYDADARRAELVGETPTLRATDRIQVVPRGEGCEVHWQADFEFKGPLRLGDFLMRPLMRRLGRTAMDGLRRRMS
ncbi:MAG: SRPBCC family protein [Myxococcota bacterium]